MSYVTISVALITKEGLFFLIFAVFVYGATGAGKTHTMLGSLENPGLTYRTVLELYQRLESKKEEVDCEIAVSYLEIYNEMVVDLMNPGRMMTNGGLLGRFSNVNKENWMSVYLAKTNT